MLGLTYDDIVNHIQDQKGLQEEEIEQKVKEKLKKLSGLISKEGAAHIVANELGINLLEHMRKEGVKIAKLAVGMRGITVIGKVLRTYDIRSFVKQEREGKVGSFLIGDATGLVRVVLWDASQIKLLEEQQIKEDTVVKIQDAYIKDNQGFKELHLGTKSILDLNPAGVNVEVTKEALLPQQREPVEKTIATLQPGDTFVQILGTVVQVFEPRFYDSCPECNKKVTDNVCAVHGTVVQKRVPILNFFFDDGTSNIRAVAFREHAAALLGVEESVLAKMQEDISLFDVNRQTILGKQFQLVGRVTKDDMFNRLEFSVQQVHEADPEQLVSSQASSQSSSN